MRKRAEQPHTATKTIRIGIDTGGTFTDFVRLDRGGLTVHKLRTTPDDQSRAILEGITHLSGGQPADVVHGSTVATNAVLERKGARVALVATSGFEDVVRIGRQTRSELYNFFVPLPRPLVAPELTIAMPERLDANGAVIEPIDETVLEGLSGDLRAKGADVAAVCLLHSYVNPAHERRVAERLRRDGWLVSVSSEVLPEYREFERWSTTVVNAYVAPLIDRYLDRLEKGLVGRLSIMQSNGGSISSSLARAEAVRTVLSGPAAGVVGARAVADAAGFPRAISFDMGGTSTDVSLIDGRIPTSTDSRIGDFPVRLPVIDIHTVGAGGGSIAFIDSGGALRVGPRSAGSVPGPVCYGAGTELTVTDANLLLGRLDPEFFLGGRMKIDVDRTAAAAKDMARALKLSVGELAEGIVRVANANMERAIRVVSVERGHDPRRFALLAFGGAGGMHACEIARTLEISTVVVPRHAGVLSALGMLVADVTRDYSASVLRPSAELTRRDIQSFLKPLCDRAIAELRQEGFSRTRVVIEQQLDVRYVGQSFEITLPNAPDYRQRFDREHGRLYGYSNPGRAVEVVAVRVRAAGLTDKPKLPFSRPRAARAKPAAVRPGRFDGRTQRIAFYRWPDLSPGHHAPGPAVITGAEATAVVPPRTHIPARWIWECDRFSPNFVLQTSNFDLARMTHPIEFEVFKNLFLSIAEEMGVTLCRTGFSPNIKERLDYSCAVYDAKGETIAQGDHMPVHLGAMPLSVRAAIDAGPMAPGDIVMLNDPFHGGTHLPDITLVSPVFLESGRGRFERAPTFYVANRAHHSDVGGMSPGSMPVAREIYQEGLILPPVKLASGGEINRDIMALLLANVRTPDEREGDVTAQIAANRVADTRLRDTVRRYGRRRTLAYASALQDYTARVVRAAIRDIPDGRYEFEDALDEDGFGSGPVKIRAAITIDRDRATVDFTGSDPQVQGSVNANYAMTLSACLYAFRCLVGDDVLYNAGVSRPLTVIAPEGSIVNARRPAAVAGGNVETSQRITDVVLGALGRALPDRIPAASQGTMNNVTLGGTDPRSGRRFAYYETMGGGMGARNGLPGISGVHTHMSNTRNTPVEAIEHYLPVRIRQYAIRKGSGGDGEFRGGDGLVREYEMLTDASVTVLSERRVGRPYGARGGEPGQSGRNTLVRKGGVEESLPGKIELQLHAGDRLKVETPGGGGYGKLEVRSKKSEVSQKLEVRSSKADKGR